jgi:PIN domain nuclease of toxin-antitoxin system
MSEDIREPGVSVPIQRAVCAVVRNLPGSSHRWPADRIDAAERFARAQRAALGDALDDETHVRVVAWWAA